MGFGSSRQTINFVEYHSWRSGMTAPGLAHPKGHSNHKQFWEEWQSVVVCEGMRNAITQEVLSSGRDTFVFGYLLMSTATKLWWILCSIILPCRRLSSNVGHRNCCIISAAGSPFLKDESGSSLLYLLHFLWQNIRWRIPHRAAVLQDRSDRWLVSLCL